MVTASIASLILVGNKNVHLLLKLLTSIELFLHYLSMQDIHDNCYKVYHLINAKIKKLKVVEELQYNAVHTNVINTKRTTVKMGLQACILISISGFRASKIGYLLAKRAS